MLTIDQQESRLWAAYQRRRSAKNRNALLVYYYPWISYTVNRWLAIRRMTDRASSMMSFVAERLLKRAIPGYTPGRSLKPKSFLMVHIFGAMHDGFRDEDEVNRTFRERRTAVRKATEQLMMEFCRQPTDSEVAAYVDWDESSVIATYRHCRLPQYVPDDEDECPDFMDTLPSPEQSSMSEAFRELTKGLSHRQRHMVWLRYVYGSTPQEIGEYYNNSRPWVCDIVNRAVRTLQKQREAVLCNSGN